MASWYFALKSLHVACAVLSIAGFLFRCVLMLRDSPWLQSRWARVLPHVNDSLLLAAGIALMVIPGQYPWTAPWLAAKLLGLVAYVVLGSLALKRARTRRVRVASGLAALLVVGWMVSVALTKNPAGFLA